MGGDQMQSLIFFKKNGIIFGSLLIFFVIAVFQTNICAQNGDEVVIEDLIVDDEFAETPDGTDDKKTKITKKGSRFGGIVRRLKKYKGVFLATSTALVGALALFYLRSKKGSEEQLSEREITSESEITSDREITPEMMAKTKLENYLREMYIEGNPSELKELEVRTTQKEFSFKWLKFLPNLKRLVISLKNLDGVPEEIRSLEHLEELTLFGDKVKDFSVLKGLKKLKKLNISSSYRDHIYLERVPEDIGGL